MEMSLDRNFWISKSWMLHELTRGKKVKPVRLLCEVLRPRVFFLALSGLVCSGMQGIRLNALTSPGPLDPDPKHHNR